MILGTVLVLGALLLFLFNQKESNTATDAVTSVMTQLVKEIQENSSEEASAEWESELQIPVELLTEEDKKMTEVEIDGYMYIGYLSIPTLGLDLPIMSTWSYPQLKIAPCRYTGSVRGEDLVLLAHNYTSHFGKISHLELGDRIIFTDMDGVATYYEVVGTDVLEPTAVDEMTSGDFDLTLFTCTYGGASRVTVYCNRVSE